MTQPQPQEQPEDGATDGGFEHELNEVLAQASSLVQELSAQVGSSDDQPAADSTTGSEPEPGTSPHVDENAFPADVEGELRALEDMLAQTKHELHGAGDGSEAAPDPSTDEEAGRLPPSKAATDDSVPDFMAEFTQSEERASEPAAEPTAGGLQPASSAPPSPDAGHPAQSAATAADPKPGVVGTGMMGVVGTALPAKPTGEAPAHAIESPEEQDEAEAQTPELRERIADAASALADRLSPVTYNVAECAVRLLESADRPFARLGETLRQWIGWVALATLGTSVVVLILSFLLY